jgi:hypothetical protein
MAAESKDVGRDIAKLALADSQYDTSTLDKVMAYCWEQLQWRQTDAALLTRLDLMRTDLVEASA